MQQSSTDAVKRTQLGISPSFNSAVDQISAHIRDQGSISMFSTYVYDCTTLITIYPNFAFQNGR